MSRRGGQTDEPLLPTGINETGGKSSCSIGRVFIALIILGAAAAGIFSSITHGLPLVIYNSVCWYGINR